MKIYKKLQDMNKRRRYRFELFNSQMETGTIYDIGRLNSIKDLEVFIVS